MSPQDQNPSNQNLSAKGAEGIYGNLTSYGDVEFSKYLRRAFLASAGLDHEDMSRPVVGIAHTMSDYTTCHRDMDQMVEAVKRGVLEAGGLPFVFPTISLGEILISPTSMLYRNLMALETEEMIGAYPMDAVVLLGGCDKTVPAQLMAALSANKPAIFVVTGPMRTGNVGEQRLGACTDCRSNWAQYRAGALNDIEIKEIEANLAPTGGTCMVMGSASTIACVTEAMGLMLPRGGTAPSGSGERLRLSAQSGRRAVELGRQGLRPMDILTRESFENALTVLAALSGSTNTIVHLTAIARRAGIELSLDDFHEISQKVPLLVNCKPAGNNYLEDMHKAGGVPVLLKTLAPILHLDVPTLSGQRLADIVAEAEEPGSWQDIIYSLDKPLGQSGALATLYGSLAPDGAVIKRAAASAQMLKHRGPAVVFDSPEDVSARIDDPSLAITPDHVLVMRNGGPVATGMPEAGSMPIPRYLGEQGVKDMVRISDARMSGTAYGTVVLHVSPEGAVGGPLALVQDGDMIELDVDQRRVDLLVDESELERRRALWKPPQAPERGYRRLYAERVQQAHLGADFDFL